MATLRDIARALKVSESTVSRALANHPRISEATRVRVQQAAREMHYRPHVGARAMVGKRWEATEGAGVSANLALFEEGAQDADLRHRLSFQHAQSVSERWGYALIPIAARRDLSPEALGRRLKALNIQGVLIGKLPDNWLRPEAYPWDRCAWLSIDQGNLALPIHTILGNPFHAILEALKHIAATGKRRVAIVSRNSLFLPFGSKLATVLSGTPVDSVPELVCRECILSDNEAWREDLESFAPDALLTDHVQLGYTLKAKGMDYPWASLGLRPEDRGIIAGIPNSGPKRIETAIDMLDLYHRRQQTGLPTHRQTLMIEEAWSPGSSL